MGKVGETPAQVNNYQAQHQDKTHLSELGSGQHVGPAVFRSDKIEEGASLDPVELSNLSSIQISADDEINIIPKKSDIFPTDENGQNNSMNNDLDTANDILDSFPNIINNHQDTVLDIIDSDSKKMPPEFVSRYTAYKEVLKLLCMGNGFQGYRRGVYSLFVKKFGEGIINAVQMSVISKLAEAAPKSISGQLQTTAFVLQQVSQTAVGLLASMNESYNRDVAEHNARLLEQDADATAVEKKTDKQKNRRDFSKGILQTAVADACQNAILAVATAASLYGGASSTAGAILITVALVVVASMQTAIKYSEQGNWGGIKFNLEQNDSAHRQSAESNSDNPQDAAAVSKNQQIIHKNLILATETSTNIALWAISYVSFFFAFQPVDRRGKQSSDAYLFTCIGVGTLLNVLPKVFMAYTHTIGDKTKVRNDVSHKPDDMLGSESFDQKRNSP